MDVDIADRFRALRSSAPFWSLRAHEETAETLVVRNDTVEPPHRTLDRGAMLTAVTEGGCGYCATSDLSVAGLQAALDRAAAWAEATRAASVLAFDPAAMPAPRGEYQSPAREASPGRGALLDLLAAECRAASLGPRIVERVAALSVLEEERVILTNTGGALRQRFLSVLPHLAVTANDGAETQTRTLELARQGGFELLSDAAFAGSGARVADDALRLLAAPNCPAGRMDLLLMPDQMMLQVHESIGHPLELDRILGDERNYAGTSFVTPDMFGTYRYGSALLNVAFDPTIPGELASYAFDDDGAPAAKALLIRDGILVAPLGGTLSRLRAGLPGSGHGAVANSRASSWNRPPIDRMANLNVEPGTSTLAEMVASIGRGVLMRTNRSWSIDDARNKFQFGCEWGELIEDGRVTGVVKNPNYRGVSASFWRNLRMVGDRGTFEVHGTLYCGKGEPNQGIHCGHGAPACVFADVDVFGGEGR